MNVRRVGIFLVCATLMPLVAHAQLSAFFTRQMMLSLTPENPKPGETVRLSVTSYNLDLDRSVITWKANGVPFAQGVGLKDASIVAGGVGSVTDITVEATADTGDNASAEATISPAQMQVLWTSDSYAPPFYKGRKLAGTDTTVRAYALTDFTRIGAPVPEVDIIYTWYRNGSAIAGASGRGKSTIALRGPARGTDILRVVAETADRTQRAEATTPIIAYDARLVLYENHPLFGVLYHRAIVGDVNTVERELKVTVVPYFARTIVPQSLTYDWVVNGTTIEPNAENPETLTLTADEYTGPADIELAVMNPADILMRSAGAWRIIFGAQSGIFTSQLFGE
jgi:hypothetical protein